MLHCNHTSYAFDALLPFSIKDFNISNQLSYRLYQATPESEYKVTIIETGSWSEGQEFEQDVSENKELLSNMIKGGLLAIITGRCGTEDQQPLM